MTSSQGLELATLILEDPTKATPLLRLLKAFEVSRGDPLGETMMHDVMLHVYTHSDHCRQSMEDFLSEDKPNPDDKPNPVPRAA